MLNRIKNHKHKNFDTDFANVNFKEHIEKKILDYQTLHILNMISIFKKSNTCCAVDFSGTGTGKTYTTIALCGQLDYEPIIICPKSVICYWKDICSLFGVVPKTIINYESLKKGKDLNDDMTKVKSSIVEIVDDKFVWKNIDKNKNIIIFDEAHRCKNHKTLNGKLLLAAKDICRILLLSATIAQKYDDFLLFGYMLNFYRQLKNGKKWIEGILREEKYKFNSKEDTQLASYIYPTKGSRMSYSDMTKKLSMNNITTQCYSIDEQYVKEIEKEYKKIKNDKSALEAIISSRQRIELLKIPIVIDLVEKYLDMGRSVVVFVNFLSTMSELIKFFTKKHIDCTYVAGNQTIEERTAAVEQFQENKIKLIICTISAGSESISLHDITGLSPRVSLILPSFSGKDLCQALGRIYRTGVKSIVEQKIIFCDEKTENLICEKLKEKIKFLNNFMDDDKIDPSIMDVE
ncbi:putative helicase [Bodo saltans virus]|uniref:Helicase n=1 Tax=Bodo saltans virus TaxID=2024608 RepID=A0A2H4UUX7_9VIRU|nr:putative helicase [Bodo saltans virus]ATZ80667.1 putative helicase [Bodo saltans virus]